MTELAARRVRTAFRSDIQGLRALAVLAVLANHTFPDLVTGGYVGVDIFFVISGFLISRNIARELETGNFSLAEFYRRRARRILPALFVVLVVTFGAGALLLSPQAFRELASTTVATTVFTSNIAFSRLTGYFDGASSRRPLLHMWSLSVEEQFYVLFPLLLWLVWARLTAAGKRRFLWWLWLAAVATAEIWRSRSHAAAYYLLPPRAFELLTGVIAGIGGLPTFKSDRLRHWASGVGLTAMAVSIVGFSATSPVPGALTSLPCLGAALLLHASADGRRSLGGSLLAREPMVYVGAISYSLYLWHWPVLVYLRRVLADDLPLAWALGAVGLSLLLASATYHFVEQPFQSSRLSGLPYLRLAALQTAVLLAMAGAIVQSSGVPRRFSAAAQRLFATQFDVNPRRRECHDGGAPPFRRYADACRFGQSTTRADIAVWGDSYGVELAAFLGERAAAIGRSVVARTASACPPALGFSSLDRPHCGELNAETSEGVLADGDVKTVVLIANSLAYQDHARLASGLEKTVSVLLKGGKRVILTKQIPVMPYDPPGKAGILAEYGRTPNDLGVERATVDVSSRDYDRSVDAIGRPRGLMIYDPKDVLCTSTWCSAFNNRSGVLYFDAEHLGNAGVRYAFTALADALYGVADEGGAVSSARGR